ncbi:MAG: DUF3857 domain-containing protein [Acidobacteriota bacterium]
MTTPRTLGKTARFFRLAAAAWLAAAALPLFAGGLPPEYAKTPTARDFPEADVLVLSEKIAFTLLEDGRVEKRVDVVEKILTYQGMDETGDPAVPFHKELQDLSVTRCRTYDPEGRVVDAKANSFNERTPFALEKAPAYAGWREMVITKVGLDVGAVVELSYTVADRKPWRRFLEEVVPLAGPYPALSREVSVTVPAGMDLHARLFGAAAEPVVRREGDVETTTWTLKDLPGLPPRELHGEAAAFVPTLVFTTCPDWGHQNAILARLADRAAAASSPALEAKAKKLLEGAASPYEKALRLHRYVAESINTVHWPLVAFDETPRPAAETFDSGYGHPLDKAVLLTGLLRRAGLSADIALGAKFPDGSVEPGAVPCAALLDTPVVRVETGSSVLWLDPAAPLSESSQRTLAGLKGLPLVPGVAELHTLTYPGEPLLWANLEAKVSGDLSLEGKGTLLLSGPYCPFFAVEGSTDAQKEALGRFLSGLLPGASLSSAEVRRLEPSQFVADVAFTVPAPSAKGPGLLRLGLPGGSLLEGIGTPAASRRVLPVVLPHSGREHIRLAFQLPPGKEPLYLPPALSVKNAAGSLSRQAAFHEGKVLWETEAELPSAVVPASSWEDLKALWAALSADGGKTIVLSLEPPQ